MRKAGRRRWRMMSIKRLRRRKRSHHAVLINGIKFNAWSLSISFLRDVKVFFSLLHGAVFALFRHELCKENIVHENSRRFRNIKLACNKTEFVFFFVLLLGAAAVLSSTFRHGTEPRRGEEMEKGPLYEEQYKRIFFFSFLLHLTSERTKLGIPFRCGAWRGIK
jgi:hypothetical protein